MSEPKSFNNLECMKIECPTCHATLVHKRIDDGFDSYSISKSGKVTCIASKSNGGDEVMCSKNAEHEISEKLFQKVLNLVAKSLLN